jgi:hypothetical protein
MARMRAMVISRAGAKFESVERPLPEPARGLVLGHERGFRGHIALSVPG